MASVVSSAAVTAGKWCVHLGGLQGGGAAALALGSSQREQTLHIQCDANCTHRNAHGWRPERLQQPIIAPACKTENALLRTLTENCYILHGKVVT